MEIVLRPYQENGTEMIRQAYREGVRRLLLVQSTGAGKTVAAAHMMQLAIEKGTRVAFLCDRTNLVDQTSAVLESYGIPHGIIQASHWRRRPDELIQVCSAQTLESRGFPDGIGFLVVDEAHVMRKQTTELILSKPDLKVLGMTATPFTKGMDKVYERMINTVTMNELIKQGYLVPIRMFSAKPIDMTGAPLVAGEWRDKDIEERGREIIGDIVLCWVEKTLECFGGPRKTICFSASVAHGAEICERFQAAGYNFQQISYKDRNDDQRRELIEEFRKPNSEIMGLVSCEVFTRGFDVPDCMVGIGARPYKSSLSNHIQQLGRVARPSPGKAYGLWLDHALNCQRFGADTDELFQNGVGELGSGKHINKPRKEPTEVEKKQLVCSCGFALPAYCDRCPACGKERKRMAAIVEVPGQMVEINGRQMRPGEEYLRDKQGVWQQLCWMSDRKNPGDPIRAEKFALAQFRNLYSHWPATYFKETPRVWATTELQQKVRANVQRHVIALQKGARKWKV